MLFALVAGSTEPANCGLATVVMWICGSYCEWNKHHEEEAGPNFCCSLLLPRSLHPPGYIQEGQEASYGHLLLGVYHRNSPSCTESNFTIELAEKTVWNLANEEMLLVKKNRRKINQNIIGEMFFPLYLLCYGFRPKCTLICFQLSCRTQPP